MDYNISVIREAKTEEKQLFNSLATHPLQSWEWGDFRMETGVGVSRFLEFDGERAVKSYQVTWHKLPFGKWIGYCPKSHVPSEKFILFLKEHAVKKGAVVIKFEPNAKASTETKILEREPFVAGKPLFTKYTFVIDITKSEEDLFAQLNQKTRYNVRLAQKKGVQIVEDNSKEAFEEYWRLTEETTKRQGFYAHTKSYHQKMWKAMTESGVGHLLLAKYEGKVLSAWFVFVLNKKLYYPYGASSLVNREVMANNLMMWEAIKFGKANDCQEFDMWGSLGPDPDPKDSWYGFHKFKQGYGANLVEFVGTYDLVINSFWYFVYKVADKLRWQILRLLRR